MDDFDGEALPVGQVMIELHLFDDNNVGFKRFYDWYSASPPCQTWAHADKDQVGKA